MAVFRRVDVVDSTSESLAEERGAVNGSMVTLGIVVLVVAALLIGYFAWYAPSQANASTPAVIEHTSTTTNNTTTTPVPAAAPPVIVNNPSTPVVVPSPYAVPAPAAPAPANPSPKDGGTDTNTTGNGTGAGSPDNNGG